MKATTWISSLEVLLVLLVILVLDCLEAHGKTSLYAHQFWGQATLYQLNQLSRSRSLRGEQSPDKKPTIVGSVMTQVHSWNNSQGSHKLSLEFSKGRIL